MAKNQYGVIIDKKKGDFLFLDKENKPHYEQDYIRYYLKNNKIDKRHRDYYLGKKKDNRVTHSMNPIIWKNEFKALEKKGEIKYK